MCGIYGYIGKETAYKIILEGLRKLEYRGYDSWGMATISNRRFYRTKRVGSIPEKDGVLRVLPGSAGIGHTRWATHGVVSRRNAHPHFDCKNGIAVVHNGSIYNEIELRKKLSDKGHLFKSETDTELFAHLLEEKSKWNFIDAIYEALNEVHGQYAFLVLRKKEPNKIYAIRKASPLKIGLGEGATHVSSDIYSFAGMVNKYIELEDGDVAEVTMEGLRIFDKDKNAVQREPQPVDISPEQISKGGYPWFFDKEIKAEPQVIKNMLKQYMRDNEVDLGIDFTRLKTIERVILTGAGSSYFACLIGEHYLRRLAGLTTTHTVVSGELLSQYEGNELDLQSRNTLLIAVTQSGETKDTLDALKFMKKNGVLVLTLVNRPGSEAERYSDFVIRLWAGPEISVVATKTFVAEFLGLLLLSLMFAQEREGTTDENIKIIRELKNLPSLTEVIFEQEEQIGRIARKYRHKRSFYPLSRGINVPVALEAGRKLEEELRVHTIGTSLGTSAELKHGPLTMVTGKTLVFIIPAGQEYEKIFNNMREAQARKANIIALATNGDKSVQSLTEDIIWMPESNELLSPIISAVALHLLTYHLGKEKNIKDFDRPRNLAKSVTVD